jgi:hypothetical protein
MTYKEKFVAVVRHNGRILRERSGAITLPFGAEYSILLKNLNSRRAVVKVSIDGKNVMGGQSLIVQPNSKVELREFVSGKRGTNHFKFIQKTKRIADYRGDRLDDGLVRVEFRFEKEKPEIIRTIMYDPLPWPPRTKVCPLCHRWPCECWNGGRRYYFSNDMSTSNGGGGSSAGVSCNYFASISSGLEAPVTGLTKSTKPKSKRLSTRPLPDEGITVKGSPSGRKFDYGYVGELERESSVIVIRLRGTNKNGTVIRKPVTVRTKLRCTTCGRKSKSSAKYCRNCGTYLE